jgi:alkylation response protein AidB-like acyl-CoA dehydrogenase
MLDHDTNSALLEVARAFRPRIIAERDHIEAARRIPEDIAQDLAGAGFFRISLPEAYGGLDLTPMQAMEIFDDTWTVGGLRGTGSHDVVVRDVFVPTDYGSRFTDPHVLPEYRYRIPPFSRVIPGLGAMALGIARTAIETFGEIAGAKTPQRTTQMLRNNHGAQVRAFQAESLVRSARLFLFDSLDELWSSLITTGGVTIEARADVRLAASHAVASAVQAVDLLYIGAGASSLYASCPLERAFRDVHAITLHIGVHPRVMETTGRVLFGLEPDTPLL